MGKESSGGIKVLFRNMFVPSRRQLLRAYRRIYFGINQRQIWLFTTVIAAIFAMVLIPPLTGKAELGQNSAVIFWTAVTLLWMLFMVSYLLPCIFAVITIHKMKKAGDRITMEYLFTESKIYIRNSAAEGETVLPYQVLTSIEEAGDLLLLRMGARQAIILPKEGFTAGNAAGFIRFITKKLK